MRHPRTRYLILLLILWLAPVMHAQEATPVVTDEVTATVETTPTDEATPDLPSEATATSEADTPTPDATPTPTAAVETTTYIVQRGDTLFIIAQRFRTTTAELIRLNNIANPNVIYVGQRLLVPASGSVRTPAPTAIPAQSPTATPTPEPLTDPGFARGISVFIAEQDAASLVTLVDALGAAWVRVDVLWREVESIEGQPDFAELDAAVDAFESAGLNILFTVTTSPEWARTRLEEQGPPDNFEAYAAFIGALAARYRGRVAAYQVWNEPNLRREWFSDRHRIGAQRYIDLLRGAYAAVKAADPAAEVITAGLAPTGFNDGFNAINDRLFLADLYARGVREISDALAAHPGGWANPPDATCCEAADGVETHFEDRSFYFQDTLRDYRAIMLENGDNRPLWVTKFGWGSSADLTPPSPESGYIYVTYTDLDEQAAYNARAFALAQELGFVGPMFLFNLNGCVAVPLRAENCYTSLIDPDGTPRPAFAAAAQFNGQD